jgi:hypothetical protein
MRVAFTHTLSAGFLAATAAVTAPLPKCDPMKWTRPQLPALRERLTGNSYKTQFDASLAAVNRTSLEKPDTPLADLTSPIAPDAPWKPLSVYWHGNQRSDRWDAEMLVAGSAFNTNPDLAETALFHAQAKGYHGWVLAGLASRIAWIEMRIPDALNFAALALEDAPEDRKPVMAAMAFAGAMLDYKWEYALELAKAYPLCDPAEAKEINKQIRDYRTYGSRPRLDPLVEIATEGETDISKKIEQVHAKGSPALPGKFRALRNEGSVSLSVPADHYAFLIGGPTHRDVDLSVQFHFTAADRKKTDYARDLTIALTDQEGRISIPQIDCLLDNHSLELDSETAVSVKTPTPFDWTRDHSVRIIMLGPDSVALFDGQRVYFGPSVFQPAERQIAFLLKPVGVDVKFHDVTWKFIGSDTAAEKKP